MIALLVACSTLATVDGARTLSPKQVQFTVAGSLQQGGSSLSNAGFPLPVTELGLRVGVAEDFDVGARIYPVGVLLDARYRFFHDDRWHAAVQPGIGLFGFPTLGGSLDWRAPVTVEFDVSRRVSLAGGPKLVLRDQWNDAGGEVAHRLDLFAGGALRFEVHGERVGWGLAVDGFAQPARLAGPAWSIGTYVRWIPRERPRRGNP